jgi:uncharacterized protein YbjT (DUF2867 family)
MTSGATRTIAVIGATGAQGGGVVRALQERGEFKVRALTRNPDSAKGVGDEVFAADLTRPDTLALALEGAYGVFANTNSFGAADTDEVAQGTAAALAAKAAGVEHYVWSTLPNVAEISDRKYNVPHFSNKARVNDAVADAGFESFTFVEPPFYFQNLNSPMYPMNPGPDGTPTWSVPMRPDVRGMHIGDITELGNVVAGSFENPETVGGGQYLSLSGDLVSWDDLVATLVSQGHRLAYSEATEDPWGIRDMFGYFEEYTYFGPTAEDKIANARVVTTKPSTDFATWAKRNMPA